MDHCRVIARPGGAKEIDARETVQRARMVNRMRGELNQQLRERHDAADFKTKTPDNPDEAN